MGYCGLPSKACSHCRSRRIKVSEVVSSYSQSCHRIHFRDQNTRTTLLHTWQCDLSTPSCGQCVRGHRTCFGYRNPTDLLFHDQSEQVACKARRSKRTSQQRAAEPATKVAPANFDSFHATWQLDFSKYSDATCPTPLSLSMSAESQAFCFFFSNYPSQPSKNFQSVYEDIPALYCLEPSDSPLLYIITALGLAGLSHHTETPSMEVAAGAWYDKALHKINSSLRDRELVKLDQTLLVVLLLGLYEVCIALHTPHSQKVRSLSLIRPILATRLGR